MSDLIWSGGQKATRPMIEHYLLLDLPDKAFESHSANMRTAIECQNLWRGEGPSTRPLVP